MKNPYSYLLLNRISSRSIKKIAAKSIFLFICSFVFTAQVFAQQQINVSGTVVDHSGEPVIGASVAVVGQKTGTVTDLDGKFVLPVAPSGFINVSFLGYITQTVAVNNRTLITVTLVEDTEKLDEIVVIGYGTVRRRDLTGAVSSVKSEDIIIAPTSNAMEALQGKVAGLDIIKTSGEVGKGVSMILRGTRSIYGNTNPLFVIDGVPTDFFQRNDPDGYTVPDIYSLINPSDIESIEVLKDASTTAIYGSAGANGVILVTTKKGREGKPVINFDSYVSFSGEPEYFHGMQGDEWTRYQREAYRFKNGQYPVDMSSVITDATILDAYNNGKWIDWVDKASRSSAVNQKYNLSLSAGTNKTKVFASLAYDRQEGLLRNEDQNQYNMRLNIDQEIFSWAKAGFTSNITHTIRNKGVKNTFTRSLSSLPLGDAYNESGDLNFEFATGHYTPLGDFIPNQYVNNLRQTFYNASAYLEVFPLKDLSLKTMISSNLLDGRNGNFYGAKATANRPYYAVGTPWADVTNTKSYQYTWENILSYSKTINDHSFGGTFVTSWTHNINEFFMVGAGSQLLDSWSFYRLLSASPGYAKSDYGQAQKMSYAARVNYSYKGKYLFTLSNRWDAVSWLAEGHKWDAFPAGAIAWRISDESFMEDAQNRLSNLKLRVGYGVTGNSGGMGPYSSTTNVYGYTTGGITLNGNNSSFTQYVGTYGNPLLGWEKSYNLNIGLDIGFLKGRIDASVDWFRTNTKDLLFERTMPVPSGATAWGSPMKGWENIAETSNTGIEVSINSRNIETKDFNWNTTLNFTWSKEKIESLPSGDLPDSRLFEGEPVRTFYDYKYAGIWGTNTPPEVLAAYGVEPGWIKVQTVPVVDDNGNSDNGVHRYGLKDRHILGHENPDYIVGLNNTFRYRDFDLTIYAMARYGQTIKSDLLGWYTAKSGIGTNQIAGANYWTEDNQNAFYPAPGYGDTQGAYMPSLTYRDGSFIKVKNITVGYTLPRKISKVAMIEKCRFYFTAYNPFLYVKDKQLRGTDPETKGSDGFPLYKQYVFGINLTF